MNLGSKLRESNVKGALAIADRIPRNTDGVPRYSRNKELAKWQAAVWILAQEVRQFQPTLTQDIK
jgi:hypothetical protein